MAYARMRNAPDTLLDEVIITVFRVDPDPAVSIPPLVDPRMQSLRRSLFRGSVGSDFGKTLRWNAETKLQSHLRDRIFSRNQLLNEGLKYLKTVRPTRQTSCTSTLSHDKMWCHLCGLSAKSYENIMRIY